MEWEDIIISKSEKYDIPAELVSAIIKVESSGDTNAIRYEDHYKWLYEPEAFRGHKATERIAQKTSWGLMQVMGAVARELGFKGRFLSELLKPELGIEYGCKQLKRQYKRYDNWQDAISAYNQGNNRKSDNGDYANQGYVDRVNNLWK